MDAVLVIWTFFSVSVYSQKQPFPYTRGLFPGHVYLYLLTKLSNYGWLLLVDLFLLCLSRISASLLSSTVPICSVHLSFLFLLILFLYLHRRDISFQTTGMFQRVESELVFSGQATVGSVTAEYPEHPEVYWNRKQRSFFYSTSRVAFLPD